MATHAHTPSNSSRRRALFGGVTAVVIGSGISAGAAASVADYLPPTAPDPDLELITACVAFNALERDIQATSGAGRGKREEREELIRARLIEQQEPLLERICAMPCRTLAGASALATSLLLWEAGELDVEDDPDACMNERLLAAWFAAWSGGLDHGGQSDRSQST